MKRWIVLFLLIFLTACSFAPTSMPQSAPTPTQPPASAAAWKTISMEQSGGFAGVSLSIEISADGKFTVSDKNAGNSSSGELSATELTQLNDLIASADFTPTKQTASCADCFVYSVNIQSDTKPISAELNDVTLPNSSMEPLVTYLRDLIQKH